jgi:virulence-associated protein VagC
MKTTEVVSIEGRQAVKLPDEFRFADQVVAIRKEGDAVILEPIRSTSWPPGFFESIRIDDPAFARPTQGETPPAPTMDAAS